jgi:RimJ/RimL family protein N-acetyltransferase
MTRAVRLVSGWAFDDLGLAVITWYAVVGNDASRRVAEAAGYQVEGTLRRWAENRGVREDSWAATLLPEDLVR